MACNEGDGEEAPNVVADVGAVWKMDDGKLPGSSLVKRPSGVWNGMDPDRMPGIKSVPCMAHNIFYQSVMCPARRQWSLPYRSTGIVEERHRLFIGTQAR